MKLACWIDSDKLFLAPQQIIEILIYAPCETLTPCQGSAVEAIASGAACEAPIICHPRLDAEALVLQPHSRPPCADGASEWRCSVYDTLLEGHDDCFQTAARLAVRLGLPEPDRKETWRQSAADCGYTALWHVEEFSRRARGETAWSKPYDVHLRVERLAEMRAWLVAGGADVSVSG